MLQAQRQMEPLGRGVVAVRSGNSTAYIGWRLLATDSEDVGFNLYRSANGGLPLKLNAQPITNTTDFVDSTADLTVSNSWFVHPVNNGVELGASVPFGVAANAPVPTDFQGKVAPYLSIPLQPTSGIDYFVHHCWPGDVDGDGEYDYVVSRLPTSVVAPALVDAYLRDGTFLWRVDMGYNSTNVSGHEPGASAVSVGHSDHVTVYDMDGDGRAEVLLKTARGVVLPGAIVTAPDDMTQYISILDGLTGAELARGTVPNPYAVDGPLSGHFGIMYCDGVRPSLVFQGFNRIGRGHFNMKITTWDFRKGQLTQRWTWDRGYNPYAEGHQIRIADVDHDGRDEFCELGFALDDDGQLLFDTELVHGDRFHVTDIDPDRPGLEHYAIQQFNTTLLASLLYDAATGTPLKKWYADTVVDVGRGSAGDIDPAHKGVESWSTQPNLYSAKGDLISATRPAWVNFSIWWDADLSRELLDRARVDKYGAGRLVSPYSLGALSYTTLRYAQPLYGDLFGDWREEILFEKEGRSELMIFTTVSPSTLRLVCLAQDPEYRACLTVKGYMQSTWTSFYLGTGMGAPPVLPISDAHLVWRGGGGNTWDVGLTANWFTNNLWISNSTAVPFNAGQSVLFDVTGSNTSAIHLTATLTPASVTVHSPNDYTFTDGALSGGMRLTKAGGGRLTLENTNTFTGRTLVSEGPLEVNGELTASPVIVRGGVWLDGRLVGDGRLGAGVTVGQGGGLSPGAGTNAPGKLTITNGLTLQGGTFCELDLSDDPTGVAKIHDRVQIMGNLELEGTNTIVIHRLDPTLPPGTYTLLSYTGSLVGGIDHLRLAGLEGIPVALTNPPGAIALTVQSVRSPTSLRWKGGAAGNAWDLITTRNWLNGAVPDGFVPQDHVRFDATGAANPTVSLVGTLPVASAAVDASADYTFMGGGRISGSGGLTKSDVGRLTILTANNYTGPTEVRGGTIEVNELSDAGSPGPLGAAGADPANLIFRDSTLRLAGGQVSTDRGITLGSGLTVVEVVTGGVLANLTGPMIGSGGLVKSGSGTLVLSASNTYSGGTVLQNGILQLGSEAGNQNGLGSGLVTLGGGILQMLDDNFSYSITDWNLLVPEGATSRLNADSRVEFHGSLTGGGTLDFFVPYVRTTVQGNWSGFTGRINVITDGDGGDFRVANDNGFPLGHVDLGAGILMYSRAAANAVIPIGALSADSGATISAGFGSSIGVQNAVTWQVGGLGTDATTAALIQGTVSLIKEGSGIWSLTGSNTYTGTTTVNGGTLLVNGVNGSSRVVVNNSGTLGGTGTIGGEVVVNAAGVLAPGANAGTLTMTSSLTLSSSSKLIFEVGSVSDHIIVNGDVALGGTLDVIGLNGFAAGTYTLITYSGGLSGLLPLIGAQPTGYACTLSAATPGEIRLTVLEQPSLVFDTVRIEDGSLILQGSGGLAGGEYYLLRSTSVALPASQWERIGTNQFDGSGSFMITNPMPPGLPELFYRLQIP